MEDLASLDSLSLKDAAVLRLEVDWPRGTLTMAVQGAIRPGAMGGGIHWSGVTEVSLRQDRADGPDSILAARSTDAADEITMQWGGLIRVVAARRQVHLHFHAV
jgi:hypothetical protein